MSKNTAVARWAQINTSWCDPLCRSPKFCQLCSKLHCACPWMSSRCLMLESTTYTWICAGLAYFDLNATEPVHDALPLSRFLLPVWTVYLLPEPLTEGGVTSDLRTVRKSAVSLGAMLAFQDAESCGASGSTPSRKVGGCEDVWNTNDWSLGMTKSKSPLPSPPWAGGKFSTPEKLMFQDGPRHTPCCRCSGPQYVASISS
mmetsp:Transcript_74075/g.209752  ORF Transcript_74075/g.209752 Transcript_74075/m.209752 type:complete len:201 (-) Transcript_74075:68-670(-)